MEEAGRKGEGPRGSCVDCFSQVLMRRGRMRKECAEVWRGRRRRWVGGARGAMLGPPAANCCRRCVARIHKKTKKNPTTFLGGAAVTSQRVLKQHHRKCPRAPRTSSDQFRPAHHGKSLLAVRHLLPAALQTAAEVTRCSCVVGLTVFIQRQSTFCADRIYEAVLHLL